MNALKAELFEQELTRKQFLQLLLGSGLALFGFGNFLTFLRTISDKPQSGASAGHGFGSRKFGE